MSWIVVKIEIEGTEMLCTHKVFDQCLLLLFLILISQGEE